MLRYTLTLPPITSLGLIVRALYGIGALGPDAGRAVVEVTVVTQEFGGTAKTEPPGTDSRRNTLFVRHYFFPWAFR